MNELSCVVLWFQQQMQDGGGRHLKFSKNVNNFGLDKYTCTKFWGKMHHGHAEITTRPKVVARTYTVNVKHIIRYSLDTHDLISYSYVVVMLL